MFCPGHLSDLAQNCKTADLSNIPGFISPPQSSTSLPFFLFLCCFCMITVPYSIYEVQTMDFQTLNFAQVLSEREREKWTTPWIRGTAWPCAQLHSSADSIYLRSQSLPVGKAWIKCAAFNGHKYASYLLHPSKIPCKIKTMQDLCWKVI